MQIRIRLPLAGALAACSSLLWTLPILQAQTSLAGPGVVVTYVESHPAKSAALAAELKAYARQIEGGSGKPVVIILEEIGRPGRMVVIEHWPELSSPAYAEAEKLLAAKIEPDALAPLDRHVNHPLTPALAQPAPTAFIVVMHVDIGPNSAGSAPQILLAQRDAALATPGVLGFEIAIQDQRTNHFAVCQFWKSRADYESDTATTPAKEFRRQLAPMLGSPFDERFFVSVAR